MAFKNSEAVGGGDYVQSSRGGNPKLEEPQDGASGLNAFEYLNPVAEQSSTPGAHAAAVRIFDVGGPSVPPGNVTFTRHGFRMGSNEVDWTNLQLNTVHSWLGAYGESSNDGAKATMRHVVMPDNSDLSSFPLGIVTEFFGSGPHEANRRMQLESRLEWVRGHFMNGDSHVFDVNYNDGMAGGPALHLLQPPTTPTLADRLRSRHVGM